MRWQGRRQSTNVEDRRRAGPALVGGGIGALILGILALLSGGNPGALLDLVASAPGERGPLSAEEQELGEFAATVLADTEDVWHALFREMGREYQEPSLVLFGGRIDSACGLAAAAVGPFYCPLDERVYIDLEFFDELQQRFRAPGDFAQAYVLAHEVGHHVQQLLGTLEGSRAAQERMRKTDANQMSVRVELQADYYAGVWGHHAARRGLIEAGDFEEGLRAASAIGDDRIQRETQGYVVPDSFTHGSSEQRIEWLRRGLESGDPTQGNTFDEEF